MGEQALGWLAPNGRMVTPTVNTAAQLLEKAREWRARCWRCAAARHRNRPSWQHWWTTAAASARECRAGTGFASAYEKMQQGHVKGKLILWMVFVSHVT